jgi:hypothetical protein
MINLFQTLRLEGDWWAVFIVSPTDPKDRYMLTSPFDKQSDAFKICEELRRILVEFTRLSKYD